MKKTIIAMSVTFLLLISITAANAYTLNAWEFNLSKLNGQSVSGNVLTGLSDSINIDHIILNGASTITQTVVGGSALGQSFTDSGYLQLTSFLAEGAAATSNFDLNDPNFTDLYVYAAFNNLTGNLNMDGSIKFTPGSGSIKLYLTDDGALSYDMSNRYLELAEFALVDPSGGSGLDFYGGTAADSNIALTMEIVSMIDNDLITGTGGTSVNTPLHFQLVNTNSLLNPNFNPNPDNTGVDGLGNGVSVVHVQNAGQYYIEVVPEPTTMLLLGFGLLGLAGVSRKKIVS